MSQTLKHGETLTELADVGAGATLPREGADIAVDWMHQYTENLHYKLDGGATTVQLLEKANTVIDKLDLHQILIEVKGANVICRTVVGEYADSLDQVRDEVVVNGLVTQLCSLSDKRKKWQERA